MALRSTTRMRPVDRIRVRDEGRLDLGSWILEASWCQILHDARCRSPQSDPDPLAATLLHPTGEFYQKNVSRSDSVSRTGCCCRLVRRWTVVGLESSSCWMRRDIAADSSLSSACDITSLLPAPNLRGIWLASRSRQTDPGPMHVRHRSARLPSVGFSRVC